MKNTKLTRDSEILIESCWVADGFFSRLMGLMGKRSIGDDQAMCFPRCNSIHTFFMRFPIDVVFLNKQGEVVDIVSSLPPWRLLLPRRSARHVLELGAYRANKLGIELGAQLTCHGVWA